MLLLVKVISAEFDSLNRRIIKFLGFGKSDIQTSIETGPYGVDSNPIKDMIAVYSDTGQKGKTVIIGYINKNKLADVGELRLYSTDADGVEKFYTWLKNDGTMEIGGSTDNMVRFSKLQEAFNELQNDVSSLKQVFTNWVPVPNDGGAALKSAATTWAGTTFTKDIADAKIDEIKTL